MTSLAKIFDVSEDVEAVELTAQEMAEKYEELKAEEAGNDQ